MDICIKFYSTKIYVPSLLNKAEKISGKDSKCDLRIKKFQNYVNVLKIE